MSVRIPLVNRCDDLPNPDYAYEGDGAVDLRSDIDACLEPFERMLIPTGISIELPAGYVGLVLPRSGLALKHGISLVNAPGLIDSNYRGEIGVVLINLDPKLPFEIHRGDRIAQLLILEAPVVEFRESDVLAESSRGAGGFGSSGCS